MSFANVALRVTGRVRGYEVLVVVVAANFSQLFTRVTLGPIVPDLTRSFGVGKTEIGLVLTGMWAVYALCQFPSGILADRYGHRRTLFAALAVTSGSALLIASAPTYLLFGAFTVLLGAGAGLFLSVAASLLTELYENTGQALGFLTAGALLAGLVGPVVASVASGRYGWRVVPFVGALIAATACLLVWWVVDPVSGVADRPTTLVGLETLRIVRPPEVGLMLPVAVVINFAFQSFLGFFPVFLIEFVGLGSTVASTVFGVIFLFAMVGQPVMGRASDLFARDMVLSVNILAAVVGFGAVLVWPTLPVAAGATVLIGFALTWFGTLNAVFMDGLTSQDRQVGFGLIRTLYMFFGASGSVVTGALADTHGWTAAFGTILGLLVTAVVLLALRRAVVRVR